MKPPASRGGRLLPANLAGSLGLCISEFPGKREAFLSIEHDYEGIQLNESQGVVSDPNSQACQT